MALTNFEVRWIVGRGHLHCARTEITVNRRVGHDGNFPPKEGQEQSFPNQVAVAIVLGMHGDASVAEHRLGSCGGNGHKSPGLSFHRVLDVPKMPVHFPVLHLVIRNGRAELGAPVDQVAAAVDEALPVEPDKDFAHGARKAFVQGKAGPAPVTRATQLPELLENPLAVPLLPGPNPLEERFPAQVLASLLLGLVDLALHHGLGRDPRVVRPRDPKGLVALHSPPANEHVLERVVERMPHVERAGHVGRRNDYGVGLFPRAGLRLEVPGFPPVSVPTAFHWLGVVPCWKAGGSSCFLHKHQLGSGLRTVSFLSQ